MSTEPSQASIMAAFQAGAFRSKAPAATSVLADINDPNPVGALTQPAEGEAEGSQSKTNSRKIYCFREGCGSVILQKGAATYIEAPANIIPNDKASPFPDAKPISSDSGNYGYWHVPDPYAFDNIGFSRPDTSSNITIPPDLPGGKGMEGKVKWLICAECDLGPVGWGFEGGKEAWVALDRVRYGPK